VYDCNFWDEQAQLGDGVGVTADQIFKPLAAYHKSVGLAVGTYQLDPFWLPLDDTGATNWTAGRHFANTSLNAIGLPWTLYSSYWATSTDGSQMPQFTFVPSVFFDAGWMFGHIGRAVADQSHAFYSYIMSLGRGWGMNSFEIDFMDFNTLLFDDFRNATTAVEAWQMGMNQVSPGGRGGVRGRGGK